MDQQQREQLKTLFYAAQALLTSMDSSVSGGDNDLWKFGSYQTFARKYNSLVHAVAAVTTVPDIIDAFDLGKMPGIGDTVPVQQKAFFYAVHSNLSILRVFLEQTIGLKDDEVANLANFLRVSLRKAIFSLPEKEVEIQNAVEQLLIGRGCEKGIDYDRETGRVKVSIKEVIPDFIFPRLSLALEIKLSKDVTKSKAIVDEINADIQAYGSKYAFLLFVVYDIGSIRDEQEFKHGLELIDSVRVIVVKH